MDFRLPHPVKHSIKKKKRRWKLLGGETKKLSLKHHKRNVSCQTDSSESSESSSTKNPHPRLVAGNSASKDYPSLSNIVNKENFRCVDLEGGNKNLRSIYHYCTPARQYSRKDSPIPLKSFSSLNSSTSLTNSKRMNDYFDLREANCRFLPSFKRHKNTAVPKEKQRKPARRLIEDPLHTARNDKLIVADARKSSSSSKMVAKKRISKEAVKGSRKSSSSVVSSVAESNEESLNGKLIDSTIVLSDSETSHSSVREPEHEVESEVAVEKVDVFDLDKTTSSDMSQIILESSISSGERNPQKLNEKESQSGKKPLVRSSVLNKRFNSVVEKEFAYSSNVSEFYLRVKRRVLGLQNSNSTTDDVSNPKDEIIIEGNENEEFIVGNIPENDKENSKSFTDKVKSESYDSPSRRNHVSSINSSAVVSSNISKLACGKPNLGDQELRSSPQIASDDFFSTQNLAEKAENGRRVVPQELSHPSRKEFKILESSDSEESSLTEPQVISRRVRRKSDVGRKNNSEDLLEIPDSELSSSSGGIQYRRKRAVFVVGSSESGSPTPDKSNGKDDMDLINDFHESDLERMNESESEESVCDVQEKQFEELEAEIGKSSSSDLLRRVTRRALILDSSESPSLGEKQKVPDSNPTINKKTEDYENPNLKYQPGFSTLSQSKHEDIKKWLNAIPCSNIESSEESKKTEVSEAKGNEENIKLTDMQQVLNELYGDDWLNDTKLATKAIVKKKESEIIIARLTDSDDSSTPPLLPSTPKRKLYNVNKVLGTPIPGTRHLFTPLTSVGKKGGRNIFATPKTVDSKTKSVQRYVTSDAFSSPLLTFVASLSVDHSSGRCHPEAKYFMKNFKSKKGELARKLFQIFNTKVFSNKLPADLPIIWNNRLRKTAGYCYNRRIKSSDGSFVRSSRVELSSKIVDNSARLRDTLVHELCHAATWIISEVTGGHGPTWKRWTYRAMEAFPEIPPISRCHNYDIETKYKYKCSGCNYSIGRHSKSLDVERKVCGICCGKFELFVNKKNDKGKPMPSTPRTPNAFALFVKENYGSAKKSKDNLKHKDVMKILSEQFAATKISNAIPEEKD